MRPERGAPDAPHRLFGNGLPLQDDRVRLFTVARTHTGRTDVRRVVLHEKLIAMARKDWTLSRLWVMGHLGGVPNV